MQVTLTQFVSRRQAQSEPTRTKLYLNTFAWAATAVTIVSYCIWLGVRDGTL